MNYDKTLEFKEITNGNDWTADEVRELMQDTFMALGIATDDTNTTLNTFNAIRVFATTQPETVKFIFSDENLNGIRELHEKGKTKKLGIKDVLTAIPTIKKSLMQNLGVFVPSQFHGLIKTFIE